MRLRGKYIVVLGLALPQHVMGQAEDQGGLQVDLSYEELLEADDGDTSFRSNLQLDVTSITRNQQLSFLLAGGIEKILNDGLNSRLADPRLNLNYSLEAQDSQLSFTGSYRKTDNNDLSVDAVTADDLAALSNDNGEREDFTAGFSFETGRSARFGTIFSLSYSATNFIDTATTSIVDSETLSASGSLRFDVNQAASALLTYSLSDLDRDNGVDVETQRITGSLDVDFTDALRGSFNLGYNRVRRSGSAPSSTEDGLSYGVTLTTERNNGEGSVALNSSVGENGRTSMLRLSRSVDLPRGAFSADIGVGRSDATPGTNPLYNINYTHDLPSGQIGLELGQSFSTNSVGVETVNSTFNIFYSQELSAFSQLNARFGFSDNDQDNFVGTDSDVTTFSVDYAHDLNADWSLITGYSQRQTRQSGQVNDRDERIYVGLRTGVEWRP